MQKVEGSSPFSRSLQKSPLRRGFLLPEVLCTRRDFRPALPLGGTRTLPVVPANACSMQRAACGADVRSLRFALPRRAPATYAGRRYRNGVRSWRRAIRWKLLLVFGSFIAASVIWGPLEHHSVA